MELWAGFVLLVRAGRRLGRGTLAIAVTLSAAAMALGLVAGSSDPEQQRPSVADAQALAASAAMLADGRARRGGAGYYRRTARKRV
ncbi:MAG: hypothetical protein M3370_05400, partial [Actinomycetota bacterium]|nr:hypothetical protein [Actinomycetota bacterium]